MPRAVAINVGANTSLPGVRGPIYSDGSFEYVPIPEREPTAEQVPTYRELDLDTDLPDGCLDDPVHLDPTFREYPCCSAYTYGDNYGVKARPIRELSAGDLLLFYATLSTTETPDHDWICPEWGAYLIGAFELACEPIGPDEYVELPANERERYATNAHVRRERFDAEVLALGDPDGSRLYDRAVPLSSADGGADANRIVTELSADSGKGPWWRRPLRFDEAATAELQSIVARGGPQTDI